MLIIAHIVIVMALWGTNTSGRVAMSKKYSAVIKEYSGQTVMQWLNRRLVLQAKVLLRGGTEPIGDIAFALGFDEQGSFARFFKRETGMTPTEYRGR